MTFVCACARSTDVQAYRNSSNDTARIAAKCALERMTDARLATMSKGKRPSKLEKAKLQQCGGMRIFGEQCKPRFGHQEV
jgi:hypothetical protein